MIKTVPNAFYVFAGYFYCDIDLSIAKFGHGTTHAVFINHDKYVLLQVIVGAEYIVCTHWLNIVGAAGAPTAPMVPTPMFTVSVLKSDPTFCHLEGGFRRIIHSDMYLSHMLSSDKHIGTFRNYHHNIN